MIKKEFGLLIGRCRCTEHAMNYTPRSHNQSRTFYFIPPEFIPDTLLCGACLQEGKGNKHGGVVISEESKSKSIVVFQAFAGTQLKLNGKQLNHARKV